MKISNIIEVVGSLILFPASDFLSLKWIIKGCKNGLSYDEIHLGWLNEFDKFSRDLAKVLHIEIRDP